MEHFGKEVENFKGLRQVLDSKYRTTMISNFINFMIMVLFMDIPFLWQIYMDSSNAIGVLSLISCCLTSSVIFFVQELNQLHKNGWIYFKMPSNYLDLLLHPLLYFYCYHRIGDVKLLLLP